MLLTQARAHPKITILENSIAIDLVLESKHIAGRRLGPSRERVWGAYLLDRRTGTIEPTAAQATVIATGGCGKAYTYTTNPDIATGDGLAAGFRAGAPVANLEFMQFHPTCLYHPEAKSFLISEAVRGEGAKLLTSDGKPFMHRYHRLRELAPRDTVARAIDFEMKRRGDKFVLLDMARLGRGFLKRRFPHITRRVQDLGYDVFRDPIPVVPAAHYMCGGIVVDLTGGRAERTYACGEVACTGVHGANWLASGTRSSRPWSSRRAGRAILRQVSSDPRAAPAPGVADERGGRGQGQVIFDHNWDALRRVVGLWASSSDERPPGSAGGGCWSKPSVIIGVTARRGPDRLRNIGLVADLIVACATSHRVARTLQRRSSAHERPPVPSRHGVTRQTFADMMTDHDSAILDPP